MYGAETDVPHAMRKRGGQHLAGFGGLKNPTRPSGGRAIRSNLKVAIAEQFVVDT
jgi:hypothetical protein